MAPSFFSKLVKNTHPVNTSINNSSSSPQSRSSSPSSPSPSPPTISVTSHGSSSLSQRSSQKSGATAPAGYSSDDSSSLHPNVTVIPPSPHSTIRSNLSLPDESHSQPPSSTNSPPETNDNKSHRRLKSSPAGSPTLPSPHTDEEGLATPTPATRTSFQVPSTSSLSQHRSTGNLREQAHLTPEVSKLPRSANTTNNSSAMQQAQDVSRTGSVSSKRSGKSGDQMKLDLSSDKSSLSLVSSPSQNATSEGTMSPIVESPTGVMPCMPDLSPPRHTLVSSNTVPSMPSLLLPDSSDTASLYSVGGTKKKRTWRRLSTSGSQRRSSKRQGSGLASAIAASGLAMASPGVSVPSLPSSEPASSVYVDAQSTFSSSHRTRTSVDSPKLPNSARSRQTSLSYATSDLSDRDSYRSLRDGRESSEEDDSDLDLDPDDIPVTGFAVASNKRNQDFHELFPNIPEGDYLIEGVFFMYRAFKM